MKTNAEIIKAGHVLARTADLEQFCDWDVASVCAVMGLFTAGVVSAAKEVQRGDSNETA